MAITTASQSQLGQDTAKNSQIVTTSVRLVNSGASTGPSISSIIVTDSGYNTLDDTAAATSNSYIRILGTGFTSTANVFLNGTMVPKANVTFTSSTELRVVLPVSNTGNYAVGVFNSNSAGALYSSSFVISTMPQWLTSATLANTVSNTAFSVTLSATSDSSITYANTTALPAGTTLSANGLFSGTISTGTETTYSFNVKATDIENQDSSRTFSVTVTVTPPYNLYAWGTNQHGQLGLNDTVHRSSPTQVGTGTDWLFVSTAYTSMAIKTNGTLWALGGVNGEGALGLNDQYNRSSPTQVGVETNWNKLSMNIYGAPVFATKTNNTLWGWGRNTQGQLGLNSDQNKSSPTQVGTGTDWSIVAPSLFFTAAIKTNGTLWTWGRNNSGQLGLNDIVNRSSPVQVGTGTSWSKIILNGGSMMAIKTDGTLWTWGDNVFGQLGINSRDNASSPVQVGTSTNWSILVGGWNFNSALKSDGTIWSWGRNNYRPALGLGDDISRSSPTQIGSETTWLNAAAGIYHTIATKTNGTLWAWGGNDYSQLGLSSTTNYNSPKQIGSGTTWLNPVAGIYNSMATRS